MGEARPQSAGPGRRPSSCQPLNPRQRSRRAVRDSGLSGRKNPERLDVRREGEGEKVQSDRVDARRRRLGGDDIDDTVRGPQRRRGPI